uniref:Protein kinase domain-containing protein n=1 Tax=Chromera velia CCMP2878 TaxID=1169474 RepID=A0A0G4HRZ0_9ALVE|eukprot:Cvel_8166.t1-p1 / transcript=Cvel_8166.t1 / gene=Cvel_8166 / organism=Chromera_velia_CCMP2878 / gene_product=Probable serine/threonine-protein kinase, putative / transcript_product=Probable serine/threonine-protein kinase, putative / location=Cvel_scaffold445:4456-12580(+) / protein_length=1356 / sequence_SO=supercontig / SO=protein_coding / is_pseudo=false
MFLCAFLLNADVPRHEANGVAPPRPHALFVSAPPPPPRIPPNCPAGMHPLPPAYTAPRSIPMDHLPKQHGISVGNSSGSAFTRKGSPAADSQSVRVQGNQQNQTAMRVQYGQSGSEASHPPAQENTLTSAGQQSGEKPPRPPSTSTGEGWRKTPGLPEENKKVGGDAVAPHLLVAALPATSTSAAGALQPGPGDPGYTGEAASSSLQAVFGEDSSTRVRIPILSVNLDSPCDPQKNNQQGRSGGERGEREKRTSGEKDRDREKASRFLSDPSRRSPHPPPGAAKVQEPPAPAERPRLGGGRGPTPPPLRASPPPVQRPTSLPQNAPLKAPRGGAHSSAAAVDKKEKEGRATPSRRQQHKDKEKKDPSWLPGTGGGPAPPPVSTKQSPPPPRKDASLNARVHSRERDLHGGMGPQTSEARRKSRSRSTRPQGGEEKEKEKTHAARASDPQQQRGSSGSSKPSAVFLGQVEVDQPPSGVAVEEQRREKEGFRIPNKPSAAPKSQPPVVGPSSSSKGSRGDRSNQPPEKEKEKEKKKRQLVFVHAQRTLPAFKIPCQEPPIEPSTEGYLLQLRKSKQSAEASKHVAQAALENAYTQELANHATSAAESQQNEGAQQQKQHQQQWGEGQQRAVASQQQQQQQQMVAAGRWQVYQDPYYGNMYPVYATGKTPRPTDELARRLTKDEKISFSDLRFLESLGRGEFGTVYKGVWRGQVIAIKLFNWTPGLAEETMRSFVKEIESFRHLSHPGLVKFHGACLEVPHLCVVTEYCPGGSLHNLLHNLCQKPAYRRALRMCRELASAVVYLHGLKPRVVHRDLKPLNVVIGSQNDMKLCDFGLTESMDRSFFVCRSLGMAGGSPRYMAPELFQTEEKHLNEKVDIWALACIFIEIFGGPLPYEGIDQLAELTHAVVNLRKVPYIPPSVPYDLQLLLRSCFIFDPRQRPGAEEVLKVIGELEAHADRTSAEQQQGETPAQGLARDGSAARSTTVPAPSPAAAPNDAVKDSQKVSKPSGEAPGVRKQKTPQPLPGCASFLGHTPTTAQPSKQQNRKGPTDPAPHDAKNEKALARAHHAPRQLAANPSAANIAVTARQAQQQPGPAPRPAVVAPSGSSSHKADTPGLALPRPVASPLTMAYRPPPAAPFSFLPPHAAPYASVMQHQHPHSRPTQQPLRSASPKPNQLPPAVSSSSQETQQQPSSSLTDRAAAQPREPFRSPQQQNTPYQTSTPAKSPLKVRPQQPYAPHPAPFLGAAFAPPDRRTTRYYAPQPRRTNAASGPTPGDHSERAAPSKAPAAHALPQRAVPKQGGGLPLISAAQTAHTQHDAFYTAGTARVQRGTQGLGAIGGMAHAGARRPPHPMGVSFRL